MKGFEMSQKRQAGPMTVSGAKENVMAWCPRLLFHLLYTLVLETSPSDFSSNCNVYNMYIYCTIYNLRYISHITIMYADQTRNHL